MSSGQAHILICAYTTYAQPNHIHAHPSELHDNNDFLHQVPCGAVSHELFSLLTIPCLSTVRLFVRLLLAFLQVLFLRFLKNWNSPDDSQARDPQITHRCLLRAKRVDDLAHKPPAPLGLGAKVVLRFDLPALHLLYTSSCSYFFFL